MSKNKTANPDRPRVDPLGDLKIAESRGKPKVHPPKNLELSLHQT